MGAGSGLVDHIRLTGLTNGARVRPDRPGSVQPAHRVHDAAVQPDHQVQVAAGGVSGGSHVADHLTLPDVLTHVHDIARRVVVAGRHEPAVDHPVVDHQSVAVAGVEVALGNGAGMGRVDGGAAAGAEIGSVVQLPDVQHGVEAHAV